MDLDLRRRRLHEMTRSGRTGGLSFGFSMINMALLSGRTLRPCRCTAFCGQTRAECFFVFCRRGRPLPPWIPPRQRQCSPRLPGFIMGARTEIRAAVSDLPGTPVRPGQAAELPQPAPSLLSSQRDRFLSCPLAQKAWPVRPLRVAGPNAADARAACPPLAGASAGTLGGIGGLMMLQATTAAMA